MADNNMKNSVAQRNNTSNQRSPSLATSTSRLSGEQWTRLQSQIKQHWGQLSEQALNDTQGDIAKLTALIQQQTGENQQTIETTLRQLVDREPESEGSAGAGSRTR